MSEGGKEAVRADEDVVAASEVRRLEERVRELERLLGRKTTEVEILKEKPGELWCYSVRPHRRPGSTLVIRRAILTP
jgi:transposase